MRIDDNTRIYITYRTAASGSSPHVGLDEYLSEEAKIEECSPIAELAIAAKFDGIYGILVDDNLNGQTI